jgi:hypothetical protein
MTREGKTPPNKTKPEVIDKIKSHIEKFPTQERHHCRKTSSRKYLDPKLSVRKMYELLVEQYQEQNNPVIPSEKIYRKVSLSFFY